jgi:hypothetical protein
VRADFYREGDPETVVGSARWNGRRAEVSSSEDEVRAALTRVFRPTPVAADDPTLRSHGALGDVVVPPGSLEWFRLAALHRAASADLRVRLVPEVMVRTGWDPASAYRTFQQAVTLLEAPATSVEEPVPEVAKPL